MKMKKKNIHTDVVPNLYDVVFPWNTKGDILKVMVIFFRATTINGLDRFKATKMNAKATQYPGYYSKIQLLYST